MESHYPQIFLSDSLSYLLKPTINPSNQQLELAKQSLIEKHKISTNTQQLMLCRDKQQESILSQAQKQGIKSEKKKYIDFIRKNYSHRIPEQLSTINKLRSKIKMVEDKKEEKKKQEKEENEGKNIMQQEISRKRRRENNKPTPGKKKLKEEKPQSKEKPEKKGKKEKIEQKNQMKQLQLLPDVNVQGPDIPLSDSLEIDLLNSLSQDDFDIENDQ